MTNIVPFEDRKKLRISDLMPFSGVIAYRGRNIKKLQNLNQKADNRIKFLIYTNVIYAISAGIALSYYTFAYIEQLDKYFK